MSESTTHLLLPHILAAQTRQHVTHDEALRLLDGLVQLAVLDRDRTSPPASPAGGVRYIVASGATGDWAGWNLSVALWSDCACRRYRACARGSRTGRLLIFDGTIRVDSTATEQQNLSLLGLGAAAMPRTRSRRSSTRRSGRRSPWPRAGPATRAT